MRHFVLLPLFCAAKYLSFVVYEVAVLVSCAGEEARFNIELQAAVNYGDNLVAIAIYCTHFTILGDDGSTLLEFACPRVDEWGDLVSGTIYESIFVTST